ncbi:hypothetical protein DUNSADRAFT_9433 [Dunaliella salina]|uniref:Encoded protein n=1 Tax=Dunaliella salina TaxID=3046 RepID=A0ABQ7GHF6_DUNSA|nr:hypothetical protein DUNSADRAFT_9433 [Dunaliella salina]|eukprot:KAF5834041.1 hypothetical protein DUNSADRAFT_9433 [Dunaliella salina]
MALLFIRPERARKAAATQATIGFKPGICATAEAMGVANNFDSYNQPEIRPTHLSVTMRQSDLASSYQWTYRPATCFGFFDKPGPEGTVPEHMGAFHLGGKKGEFGGGAIILRPSSGSLLYLRTKDVIHGSTSSPKPVQSGAQLFGFALYSKPGVAERAERWSRAFTKFQSGVEEKEAQARAPPEAQAAFTEKMKSAGRGVP